MKIGQYCQRQRCKHVELEQFWQAFASRGLVSDSWAFLFSSTHSRQKSTRRITLTFERRPCCQNAAVYIQTSPMISSSCKTAFIDTEECNSKFSLRSQARFHQLTRTDIAFARFESARLPYSIWDILQELVYEGRREPFVNLKVLQNVIRDRKPSLYCGEKRRLAVAAKQDGGPIQHMFC